MTVKKLIKELRRIPSDYSINIALFDPDDDVEAFATITAVRQLWHFRWCRYLRTYRT